MVLAVVMLIGVAGIAGAQEVAIARLSGPDRVSTAVAVAHDRWTDGSARLVVLVRADVAADALAATPLAADAGPLLLSGGDSVPTATLDEVDRVLMPGGTVYLAGGEAALSAAVAQQVADRGHPVQRLSGPTRTATAVAIAEHATSSPQAIYVADGTTFADALVAGATAGGLGGVVVLSSGEVLDATTSAYLDDHVGPPVIAIGPAAAAAVGSRADQQFVGADVYETSAMVAAAKFGAATGVGVASGENFPDGLSGGAHAASLRMPLLLTRRDSLPPGVAAHLRDQGVQAAHLYGGTAAISDAAAQGIAEPSSVPSDPTPSEPVPAPPPAPQPPGPPSLGAPRVLPSGHVQAANASHTWRTELATSEGFCLDDAREFISVEDGSGSRRVTSVPGVVLEGLWMVLSPTGTHATVESYCHKSWDIKGYVTVTADGDLVNLRSLGTCCSYNETDLRWREDGLLYFLEDTGDFFTPDLRLMLVNPANGQQAVLFDFPAGQTVSLETHTPSLTVFSQFDNTGRDVFIYDANGAFVEDFSYDGGDLTFSPDGEVMLTLPYDTGPVVAYRTADLRAGVIAPIAELDIANTAYFPAWSSDGLVALSEEVGSTYRAHVWDPLMDASASVDIRMDPLTCQYLSAEAFSLSGDRLFLSSEAGCDNGSLRDTFVVPISR